MKEIVESHQTGRDASWVVCIPCSHCLGSNRAIDQLVESRCSLRPAVTADVDIMVDCHLQPASVEVARVFIRAPELTRPLFIEGPVPTGNPSSMMALTGSSSVTIAGGERLAGGWEFSSAIEGRAFHIAEPDTCHEGGLLKAKRVPAPRKIAGIGLAPHNPLGPVAGVAPLHSGISTYFVIQQEIPSAGPCRDEVAPWLMDRKPGGWDPPEEPDLRIEVDEHDTAGHPFEQEALHAGNAAMPDGTVLDW